jgi:hypothetical protein
MRKVQPTSASKAPRMVRDVDPLEAEIRDASDPAGRAPRRIRLYPQTY